MLAETAEEAGPAKGIHSVSSNGEPKKRFDAIFAITLLFSPVAFVGLSQTPIADNIYGNGLCANGKRVKVLWGRLPKNSQ